MKRTILYLALAVLVMASFAFIPTTASESLAIGKKAPMSELKMKDTNGQSLSLNDLKSEKGLLVIFSCNTCPFVVGSSRGTEGWEGRYAGIKKACDERSVGMVLVNSNEAKRDKGDNLDDMKNRATEQGFDDITYVLDTDHKLADAFGAKTTPHVFLFNDQMELVYKGAIDDNVESAEGVTENWLADAINDCCNGDKVDPSETRAVGCSIKRVK